MQYYIISIILVIIILYILGCNTCNKEQFTSNIAVNMPNVIMHSPNIEKITMPNPGKTLNVLYQKTFDRTGFRIALNVKKIKNI